MNNIPGLHGKSGLSHLYKNIIELGWDGCMLNN
jgi:hypothetical protein